MLSLWLIQFRYGNYTRKIIPWTLWTPGSQNSTETRRSVPSALASSASRAHPVNGHPCRGWCRCSPETARWLRRWRSPATWPSGRWTPEGSRRARSRRWRPCPRRRSWAPSSMKAGDDGRPWTRWAFCQPTHGLQYCLLEIHFNL